MNARPKRAVGSTPSIPASGMSGSPGTGAIRRKMDLVGFAAIEGLLICVHIGYCVIDPAAGTVNAMAGVTRGEEIGAPLKIWPGKSVGMLGVRAHC